MKPTPRVQSSDSAGSTAARGTFPPSVIVDDIATDDLGCGTLAADRRSHRMQSRRDRLARFIAS
jgi:hypothetical protein